MFNICLSRLLLLFTFYLPYLQKFRTVEGPVSCGSATKNILSLPDKRGGCCLSSSGILSHPIRSSIRIYPRTFNLIVSVWQSLHTKAYPRMVQEGFCPLNILHTSKSAVLKATPPRLFRPILNWNRDWSVLRCVGSNLFVDYCRSLSQASSYPQPHPDFFLLVSISPKII